MGKHAKKLWGFATAVALAWATMVGCSHDEVNNPLPAPQPASVTGRLTATNGITNEIIPVPGYKVSIGSDTTVTDQDGKYCLPAPPHRQVTVVVTFPPPLGPFHSSTCGAGGRVMTGDPGGCDHATALDLTIQCTPI